MSTAALMPPTTVTLDRFCISVDQYRAFRRDGFLVVRGLVGADDIAELRQHTEDLMQGDCPSSRSP